MQLVDSIVQDCSQGVQGMIAGQRLLTAFPSYPTEHQAAAHDGCQAGGCRPHPGCAVAAQHPPAQLMRRQENVRADVILSTANRTAPAILFRYMAAFVTWLHSAFSTAISVNQGI